MGSRAVGIERAAPAHLSTGTLVGTGASSVATSRYGHFRGRQAFAGRPHFQFTDDLMKPEIDMKRVKALAIEQGAAFLQGDHDCDLLGYGFSTVDLNVDLSLEDMLKEYLGIQEGSRIDSRQVDLHAEDARPETLVAYWSSTEATPNLAFKPMGSPVAKGRVLILYCMIENDGEITSIRDIYEASPDSANLTACYLADHLLRVFVENY